MLMTILIIILILALIGGLPQVGVYQGGYAPSGIIGVLIIILLVLLLTGRLNI